MLSRIAKAEHPSTHVAERDRGRVRMAKAVRRSKGVATEPKRLVHVAETEKSKAEERLTMHLGVLAEHMRACRISLVRVERERTSEILLSRGDLAFAEVRHAP